MEIIWQNFWNMWLVLATVCNGKWFFDLVLSKHNLPWMPILDEFQRGCWKLTAMIWQMDCYRYLSGFWWTRDDEDFSQFFQIILQLLLVRFWHVSSLEFCYECWAISASWHFSSELSSETVFFLWSSVYIFEKRSL